MAPSRRKRDSLTNIMKDISNRVGKVDETTEKPVSHKRNTKMMDVEVDENKPIGRQKRKKLDIQDDKQILVKTKNDSDKRSKRKAVPLQEKNVSNMPNGKIKNIANSKQLIGKQVSKKSILNKNSSKTLDFGDLSPIKFTKPISGSNMNSSAKVINVTASQCSTPWKLGNKSVPTKTYTFKNCFGFCEQTGKESTVRILNNQNQTSVTEAKQIYIPGPWRCDFYALLRSNKKSQMMQHYQNVSGQQSSISAICSDKSNSVNQTKASILTSCSATSDYDKKSHQPIQKFKKEKKVNFVQRKITDMLPEKPKTRDANKGVAYNNFFEVSTENNSIFEEEIGTPGRNKPSRKSYERRFKPDMAEDEPSTEEIYQELERKKHTKLKPKKAGKEEKNLNKWAQEMNSMFEEVDKFELNVD